MSNTEYVNIYDELDLKAWQALNNWPEAAGFNPIVDDLDYAAQIKWYLWNKVGRAFRFSHNLFNNTFEKELIEQDALKNADFWFSHKLSGFPPQQQVHLSDRLCCARKQGKKIVLVPLNFRLTKVVQEMQNSLDFEVVFPEMIGIPPHEQSGMLQQAVMIYENIKLGLTNQSVELVNADDKILRKQIFSLLRLTAIAEAQMNFIKPDIVLVHTDDGGRPKPYVHLAKRAGIPVLMCQEGLDCEHYWFDRTYATHVMAWGKERIGRYAKIPENMSSATFRLTGNPEYDFISVPEGLYAYGHLILWTTRPYNPDRCYLPSRSPQEGIDILSALLDYLQEDKDKTLCVKAHSNVPICYFQALVKKRDLSNRVLFSDQRLSEIMSVARVVVSDDSTAGLDAMLFGKPLVHSHFAPTSPTMPFVSYGAAYAAHTPNELHDSILRVLSMNNDEAGAMHKGQCRFIEDFAYRLDGGSLNRVMTSIREVAHHG